jgi:hypothetical protein
MLNHETKEVMALLVKLFPKWGPPSEEELAIWAKRLREWRLDRALSAVAEHRVDRGGMHSPDFDGLQEAYYRLQREERDHAPQHFQKRYRTVDWIRGESAYRECFHGLDDGAVILTHYGRCWDEVRRSGLSASEIETARQMIVGHCRAALLEIEWEEKDAKEAVSDAFAIGAGT